MKKMYAELMKLSDECMYRALKYRMKNEIDLVIFYQNASNGFKNKALDLYMED